MSNRSPLAVLRWWNCMPYHEAPPRSNTRAGGASSGRPSQGNPSSVGAGNVVTGLGHIRLRRLHRDVEQVQCACSGDGGHHGAEGCWTAPKPLPEPPAPQGPHTPQP